MSHSDPRSQTVRCRCVTSAWCTCVDDIESHQLVLDSMPILLTMFTGRQNSSTQLTVQLLRTFSLICHRNRVAQVARSVCPSVYMLVSCCSLHRSVLSLAWMFSQVLTSVHCLLSSLPSSRRHVQSTCCTCFVRQRRCVLLVVCQFVGLSDIGDDDYSKVVDELEMNFLKF